MKQAFYFYANPYQPRSQEAARSLAAVMAKMGADIYAPPWLAALGTGTALEEGALFPPIRAIVALGGDGTLLRALPLSVKWGIPLMGVHTGTVGFLMPGDAQKPEETASLLLAREYPIQRRPLLDIRWEDQRHLALNDVSLTRGEHPGVVEVTVLADDEMVFHAHGDGALISTPQGATAYAMAAGGPIVRPDTPCLLAVPVCARELLLRPAVLPLDARITLLAHGHERRRLQLAVDGQLLFPIQKETRVEVCTAPEQALLISPGPHTFFNTLRIKQQIWNQQEQE